MEPNLLQGIVALFLVAAACMGWSGYWMEFNRANRLEQKVKKFYGETN